MNPTETEKDIVQLIIDFEYGDLDFDETVVLFQYLVESGMVYSLNGHYQRFAQSLIDSDLI
jgi:hypothetical protein